MLAVGMAVATAIGVLCERVRQAEGTLRKYLVWSAMALLAIVLADAFVFNRDAIGTSSLEPVVDGNVFTGW